MKTTLYRPDTVPEGEGLIAETVQLLLTDFRVVQALTWKTTTPEDSEIREGETLVDFAVRGFRFLLPTGNAKDIVRLRSHLGWTRTEIEEIVTALNDAFIHLRRQAEEVQEGFGETLRRDAEKLERLRDRWEALGTS